MCFSSWMRNWTSTRFPRSWAQHRPTPPRFRPQLEVLEGRDVPSTLTVTNNLDNGAVGSLRYEIGVAQSGDTIVFDNSLKGTTITVGSTLDINKSLAIEGLGAKNLAISGGNQSASTGYWRVFEVDRWDAFGQRVQATLSGMTIENGIAATGNVAFYGQADGQGGGILNLGTLTLSGCTATGNNGSDGGGGIANEIGGTLTISGSTVSGNFAAYDGGGIYNDGTLTLSGSTVTKNSTGYGEQGGGIYNDYSGVLTILSSTVNGNKPDDLYNLGSWSADKSSKIGKVGP